MIGRSRAAVIRSEAEIADRHVSPLDNDCELIPSKSSDYIPGTKNRLETWPDFLQYRIAGWVAKRVVDFLEVVQVDHQQSEHWVMGSRVQ